MEEVIAFRRHGQQQRLSRQQVIDALREQTPEPTNAWWVEVEGRRFPIKQAWACATGTPQEDVRVDLAMPWLERLGFRPMRARPRASHPLVQRAPVDHAAAAAPRPDERCVMEHRAVALAAAVQLIAGRPDARVEDVLETAEAFETWLARRPSATNADPRRTGDG